METNNIAIIDRIKKVLALSESGIEGEKTNAEKLLKELCEKYHIDISSIKSDEKREWYYKIDGYRCRELFNQIVAKTAEDFEIEYPSWWYDDKTYKKKWFRKYLENNLVFGKNVAIECTSEFFITITTAYEILQKSLNEHFERFFLAFLIKNDLLLKPTENNKKEENKEELEKYFKALMMASNIDKSQIHKQIENTEKC